MSRTINFKISLRKWPLFSYDYDHACFNRKGYFLSQKRENNKKGLKRHQKMFVSHFMKFKSLNECPLNLSWTITFTRESFFSINSIKRLFVSTSSHALRLNLIFNFMPLKGIAYEKTKEYKKKGRMWRERWWINI